jgi:hypothetical protein
MPKEQGTEDIARTKSTRHDRALGVFHCQSSAFWMASLQKSPPIALQRARQFYADPPGHEVSRAGHHVSRAGHRASRTHGG